MVEGTLLLATLAGNFNFTLQPDYELKVNYRGFVLEAGGGLVARFSPRR